MKWGGGLQMYTTIVLLWCLQMKAKWKSFFFPSVNKYVCPSRPPVCPYVLHFVARTILNVLNFNNHLFMPFSLVMYCLSIASRTILSKRFISKMTSLIRMKPLLISTEIHWFVKSLVYLFFRPLHLTALHCHNHYSDL
jgi:hypothetical protein